MRGSEIDKRDHDIYLMRGAGRTYREIGEKFALTKERARQIYWSERKKRESGRASAPFRKGLSTRSRNCLLRHFGSEEILSSPDKIAEMSRKELLRIRNIGIKSAEEIMAALRQSGHR